MAKKLYPLSLFIFRRDLRLTDNIGLITALSQSNLVIPCFIFDPRQIGTNPYKGTPALQFLYFSLKDLQEQLAKKHAKLYFFYGIAEKVVEKLLESIDIDAVYFNADYTPFSRLRDENIKQVCQRNSRAFYSFDDALLLTPQQALKSDGQPYRVFSAFYKHAQILPIEEPRQNRYQNYYINQVTSHHCFDIEQCEFATVENRVQGGRHFALHKLANVAGLSDYAVTRDFPCYPTSGLSAHLKFTTCSVREVFYTFKKLSDPAPLIRELYWRDFFTFIAFYFPHVFGQPFHTKFQLAWETEGNLFKAWCQGRTGFPIVDAGMRQLNSIGYMHNRARLITASFLVKDLHINWLAGEKYFANHLIDYDPAVNNGNWQWVASTGTDSQPYFRIFNPWLQQKKYDPDCKYIKTWLPELRHVDNKIIHNWFRSQPEAQINYPKPIVDHQCEVVRTKKLYRGDKI